MSFAYFPFYTGDYYRDTRHLSMLQHGAYRQLLDHCWDQRGPLPLDLERCYRICGAVSKEEQEAVRGVIAEFFVRMDDGHYNKRVQVEIERANALSGKRAGAAHERWKARQSIQGIGAVQDANAMQVHSKSNASAPSPSPSPSPSQNTEPTVLVAEATPQRPPPCPTEALIALYHEHLPMLPRVEVVNEPRKRALSARWREVVTDPDIRRSADVRTAALDWFAWYFGHAAKSRFLTGRAKDWRADLDFLLLPKKFAKVVEGSYHRETA